MRSSIIRWFVICMLAAVGAALVSVWVASPPLWSRVRAWLYEPVSAATVSHEGPSAPRPVSGDGERLVRTSVVGSERGARSYTYAGEVRGRYESALAFQTGGRIVKRNVQLGDVVHAGDILMEIDPKDIKESVAMASAQARAAESQMRLAETNLGRFERLQHDGAVPKAQLDQVKMAYDSASAARDQASALRAQSSNQLEYSLLRADKGGVIAGISAEVGQVTAPGVPVVTLVQDGDREVEISVPENRIDSLRDVKSIKASFWALAGVELGGEIRETAPMADPLLRTYKARIRLLSPVPEVRLGMTASVRVEEADHGELVRLIPLSAVYQTEDRPNVWVVKDGKLELRAVELDGFGHETVRVLKGLEDGEAIVTAGVHKLMPGQRVRVAAGDAR